MTPTFASIIKDIETEAFEHCFPKGKMCELHFEKLQAWKSAQKLHEEEIKNYEGVINMQLHNTKLNTKKETLKQVNDAIEKAQKTETKRIYRLNMPDKTNQAIAIANFITEIHKNLGDKT